MTRKNHYPNTNQHNDNINSFKNSSTQSPRSPQLSPRSPHPLTRILSAPDIVRDLTQQHQHEQQATELTWSKVKVLGGETPQKRGFHTSTRVNNKLYIIGGDAQNVFYKDVRVFNLETSKWESNETWLDKPRAGHSCVYYRDCLYVFGGKQSEGPKDSGHSCYLSDLLEYDLNRKTWKKVSCNIKLQPRGAHSCSLIESQKKMYIFGGLTSGPSASSSSSRSSSGSNIDLKYLNIMHVFDFEKREWSQVKCKGEIPPARAGHSSCVVKEFIYIFGGRKGSNILQDFYVLDTKKMVWKKIYQKNPPATRAGHSMCYYPEGGVIILWGGGDWSHYFDEVLTFDVSKPKSGEWKLQPIKQTALKPPARFWHSMTIYNNQLFMFGGGDKLNLYNDFYVLDISPLSKTNVSILTRGIPNSLPSIPPHHPIRDIPSRIDPPSVTPSPSVSGVA